MESVTSTLQVIDVGRISVDHREVAVEDYLEVGGQGQGQIKVKVKVTMEPVTSTLQVIDVGRISVDRPEVAVEDYLEVGGQGQGQSQGHGHNGTCNLYSLGY